MGFISVLIIIVCALLVIVVLIQNSKGGGIASNFASSTQVVGVKRQAEIIEKITWGLAAALIILSLSSSAFSGQNGPVAVDQGSSVVKDAPAQQNGNGQVNPGKTKSLPPNGIAPGGNNPPTKKP